jgi:hypothetical protein
MAHFLVYGRELMLSEEVEEAEEMRMTSSFFICVRIVS